MGGGVIGLHCVGEAGLRWLSAIIWALWRGIIKFLTKNYLNYSITQNIALETMVTDLNNDSLYFVGTNTKIVFSLKT